MDESQLLAFTIAYTVIPLVHEIKLLSARILTVLLYNIVYVSHDKNNIFN